MFVTNRSSGWVALHNAGLCSQDLGARVRFYCRWSPQRTRTMPPIQNDSSSVPSFSQVALKYLPIVWDLTAVPTFYLPAAFLISIPRSLCASRLMLKGKKCVFYALPHASRQNISSACDAEYAFRVMLTGTKYTSITSAHSDAEFNIVWSEWS